MWHLQCRTKRMVTVDRTGDGRIWTRPSDTLLAGMRKERPRPEKLGMLELSERLSVLENKKIRELNCLHRCLPCFWTFFFPNSGGVLPFRRIPFRPNPVSPNPVLQNPVSPIESRFVESRFAESRFAESRFAESRFAESRFAESCFAESRCQYRVIIYYE